MVFMETSFIFPPQKRTKEEALGPDADGHALEVLSVDAWLDLTKMASYKTVQDVWPQTLCGETGKKGSSCQN